MSRFVGNASMTAVSDNIMDCTLKIVGNGPSTTTSRENILNCISIFVSNACTAVASKTTVHFASRVPVNDPKNATSTSKA